jgi:riboflavin synthase
MFTGIVEELGRIRAVDHREGGTRLEVACATVLDDATIGASIAVNGVCVTVVELDDTGWVADLAAETLARSTLGRLAPGDPVNLERPVRLADRLGGHLVQGHVDAVGTVWERTPVGDGSTRLGVRAPRSVLRYVVEKGSVTLDGVSLTVTDVADDGFGVALIPHTLDVTTLGSRMVGAELNVEADLVAKYVERLLEPSPQPAPRR